MIPLLIASHTRRVVFLLELICIDSTVDVSEKDELAEYG